jgi:hypothetical protein
LRTFSASFCFAAPCKTLVDIYMSI